MKDSFLDIEQFRQGNKQAFKYTFDSLYKSLCSFINRYINNLPVAEDIIQDTFLSLWNHHQEMSTKRGNGTKIGYNSSIFCK